LCILALVKNPKTEMLKRLILLFGLLLINSITFGQCVNLNFDNCVEFNQTINIDVDNGTNSFWTTTSPSGVVYYSNNSTSQSINFNETGTWTIDVFQPTSCFETTLIEVYNSSLNISTSPIIYQCQGQTINILNHITVSNISVLPLNYDFIINGTSTTDSIFTLQAGINTIDITVTDASGCTANTTMNINATSNSIVPPIYTITDANGNENIINSCNSTDLTFTIQNPISNYTYTWDVQGSTGTGTFTQSINATIANPGYIPVSLFLYDSSSGCTIEYYDTITSVGLDLSYVGIDQELVPSCVFDSTPGSLNLPTLLWPIDNNGNITQMGPNDTIFWSIFCDNTLSQNADIVDTFWTYQDLPQLNQPDPTYPFEPDGISGFEHYWTSNSCNCINEQYYIELNLQSACGSNGGYISWKKVNDPIEAIINIPPVLCVNEPETFQNNSEIGCDGNTFDANEDILTYEWDFGNCVTLSSSSTATSSDPFPDVTYSYPEAGIYTVAMSASSYCPPIDYDTDAITVYPNPIVNCTGTDECFNDVLNLMQMQVENSQQQETIIVLQLLPLLYKFLQEVLSLTIVGV